MADEVVVRRLDEGDVRESALLNRQVYLSKERAQRGDVCSGGAHTVVLEDRRPEGAGEEAMIRGHREIGDGKVAARTQEVVGLHARKEKGIDW